MNDVEIRERKLVYDYAQQLYTGEIDSIATYVRQRRELFDEPYDPSQDYDVAWQGFVRAINDTRVMYQATDLNELPDEARIVAYYPHGRAGSIDRFEHALWVPMDHTGDHGIDCVVLDMVGYELPLGMVAEWVRVWSARHPQGMGVQNGWFGKPVVRITGDVAAGLRSLVGIGACDLWIVNYEPQYVQKYGEAVREVSGFELSGHRYATCLVYDKSWGKRPDVSEEGDQPSVDPEPLRGTVGWLTPQMNSRFAHVESHDGGETWLTQH